MIAKKIDFLRAYFKNETSNWKIVQARTLWDNSFPAIPELSYAQVFLKFDSSLKKDNYIVFERKISNNISFLSWKVLVPEYE